MKPRQLYIAMLVAVLVGVLLGTAICQMVNLPFLEQPFSDPEWRHPGQDYLYPPGYWPHEWIQPTLPPREDEVHA